MHRSDEDRDGGRLQIARVEHLIFQAPKETFAGRVARPQAHFVRNNNCLDQKPSLTVSQTQAQIYCAAMRTVPQGDCEGDWQLQAQRCYRVCHVTLRALGCPEGCNRRER